MEHTAPVRRIVSALVHFTTGLGALLVLVAANPGVQPLLSASSPSYAAADTTRPDSVQADEERPVRSRGLIIRGAQTQKETLDDRPAAPDSMRLQEMAVQALSQLPAEQAVPRLVRIAETHPHIRIRRAAVVMLGRQHNERVVDALADIARSDDAPAVRRAALQGLGRSGSPRAETVLIHVVRTDEQADVREAAIHWLGRIGGERAADVLMEIVDGG